MESDGVPSSTEAAALPFTRGSITRFTRGWIEAEALSLLAVAVYAAVVVRVLLPVAVVQDTWLALVAGREVAQGGPPRHETLTFWAKGADWIDQQWLAQLVLYGIDAVGGIRAVVLALFAIVLLTYASCVALARRLGASSRNVLVIAVPAILLAPLSNARPQALALPLFVAVVGLLAFDGRQPSPRVFLVLPVLALWANLHGSVVLAVLLVLAYCAVRAVRRVRGGDVTRSLARHGLLAGGALAALFASPYGFGLVGYYRTLLVDPPFADLVKEWRPPSPSAGNAAFFVAAFLTAWLIGRNHARASAFQVVALAITLAAALSAQRNMIFFALAVIVLAPPLLEGVLPASRATDRVVNTAIGGVALLVTAGAVAVAATRSEDYWLRDWSFDGAAAAARAAAGGQRVLATDRNADFLLWTHPELRGRVALDVRFELYSSRQIERYVDFKAVSGAGWLSVAACCRVLALDVRNDSQLIAAFGRPELARTVYADERMVVLERAR